MLAALFGGVIGQAVTFYTATFYAYYFLERVARVDGATVTVLTGIALAIGAPLLLACGWLSDRIGRKPALLAGLALAALLYFPLFGALLDAANPALAKARADAPVVLLPIPPNARCSSIRWADAPSTAVPATSPARSWRAPASATRRSRSHRGRRRGSTSAASSWRRPTRRSSAADARAEAIADFQRRARAALEAAGHGLAADPAAVDRPRVVALLVALLALPRSSRARTRRCWPSCSRANPLHGAVVPAELRQRMVRGFLPAVAFTIVAATGDVFAGLWYPVSLAALCLVVGALALPETRGRPMHG